MSAIRLFFSAVVGLVLIVPVCAFQVSSPTGAIRTGSKTQAADDELQWHLSAAGTYQLSGDLDGANVENRAVASIALQRLANIAFRERQAKKGIEMLKEALLSRDSADARTRLALGYMELGQTEEGIEQAQAVIGLDPDNGLAHETLGQLFYLKGDYAAAIPGLERALVLKPDFDSAYTLGMAYLQLKQIDRATLLFEEMLTAVNKKASLHVIFGKAYEETNYPLQAEREFQKAITAEPKITGAHFYLGYTIMQHGGSERLAEAGKEFDLELKVSPRNPYSNFFAGVVASSEGDNEKAIRYLQESIRLNPNIGPAYLFLGQSQVELGQNVPAERNLRKAITLNGDVSSNSFQIRRAHVLLGRLLNKLGRKAEGEKELAIAREQQGQLVESARDEIRKVLGGVVAPSKTTPTNPDSAKTAPAVVKSPAETAKLNAAKAQLAETAAQAYHNLGVIAVQQGRTDEAIGRFGDAARWKPNFPGLDRNWGIVAFRAGQYDKAIGPLARHLKTRPDDALARRMLGVSYYFGGNHKMTAETLKPVEAGIHADPELAYFYGISLVQIQKHVEAAAIFKRISDKNQNSAEASFYAGQGLVLTGDYERAVAEFRHAAELDPKMLQAHYNAGQSLIRMNRLSESEKEFRLELGLNPTDASAKYHLAYVLLENKSGLEEAISLLKDAIDTRYDYADARYQLGKALIEKHDFAEAIGQLETAAGLEPKKDYIRYQLSIAYRRASRPADAERELKIYSELKAANRNDTPAGMGNKKNVP